MSPLAAQRHARRSACYAPDRPRAADHLHYLRRAGKWAEIRNWGQRRRGELTNRLSHIAVLPGDEAVAATWGRLSAAAVPRGRPRPVNDMWVAVCCLTHGIPLATLNLKDYEDFDQYHGLRILGRE